MTTNPTPGPDDPANLEPGQSFAEILDDRLPGSGAGDRWRQLHETAPEAER